MTLTSQKESEKDACERGVESRMQQQLEPKRIQVFDFNLAKRIGKVLRINVELEVGCNSN